MKICNMALDNIIEAINRYIDNNRNPELLNRQHLVLQRIVAPHTTFKAYKVYEYILWVVDGIDKYRLLTLKQQIKSVSGTEELITEQLELQFTCGIVELLMDKKYLIKQVIDGEYPTNNNEPVPDPSN